MEKRHHFQTRHALEVYSATRNLWDTPLFESESFVALPTVGALVEGWLLIVPKTPTLAFAHVSGLRFLELENFLKEVVPAIESNYGPVSVFEHGPCAVNSTIGCGVDYAHLHLVPTQCDLLAGAKQIAPNIQWNPIASLKEIQGFATAKGGYWFLQQTYGTGQCYLGKCAFGKTVSQLFRRVIANYMGCPAASAIGRALQEKLLLQQLFQVCPW